MTPDQIITEQVVKMRELLKPHKVSFNETEFTDKLKRDIIKYGDIRFAKGKDKGLSGVVENQLSLRL